MSEYNDVRMPDRSMTTRLLYDDDDDDFFNDDEFLCFQSSIMEDMSISDEVKSTLLSSRREEIKRINTCEMALHKSTMILRKSYYDKLLELFFSHLDEFEQCHNMQSLMLLIEQYQNGTINEINLDDTTCWKIRRNIELFCSDDNFKENLKKIFVPNSIEQYELIAETMAQEEIKKQEAMIQEEIKKQEAIDLQIKLEQEKQKEITERNNLISPLLTHVKRLKTFDGDIQYLSNQITPGLEKYLSLELDKIEVTQEVFELTIKFIKQIRMDEKSKENLIDLFCQI